MALGDAILAALLSGESSGYDLAKAFDISVANYWTATAQQLYRELDKLNRGGLVEARTVEQAGKPNKRLYSLTTAGHQALREFVAADPKPTAIRDELLVALEAMRPADIPHIIDHIAAKRAASQRKLAYYERSREYLLDGRTQAQYLSEEDNCGRYLTLMRGISFERDNIRWCEDVTGILSDKVRASGRRGVAADS